MVHAKPGVGVAPASRQLPKRAMFYTWKFDQIIAQIKILSILFKSLYFREK
jgi:hypothetical protein